MYHAKDRLFFERKPNGDVRIIKTEIEEPPEATQRVTMDVTVPASMWASVVASVSYRDEDYASWLLALVNHNGRAE